MSALQDKFMPRISSETSDWWQYCKDHKLMIQQCGDCAECQFYPRTICTSCSSKNLKWMRSAGRGTVQTFTICRLPVSPAYADDVPYVVALIKLDEGPVMMSNLIDCELDLIEIGMKVEVDYKPLSEDVTIPQFRPE